METFSKWLFDELCNDCVIDEDEVDISELSTTFLLTTTDLYEDDIENYRCHYIEHCKSIGVEPVLDLED